MAVMSLTLDTSHFGEPLTPAPRPARHLPRRKERALRRKHAVAVRVFRARLRPPRHLDAARHAADGRPDPARRGGLLGHNQLHPRVGARRHALLRGGGVGGGGRVRGARPAGRPLVPRHATQDAHSLPRDRRHARSRARAAASRVAAARLSRGMGARPRQREERRRAARGAAAAARRSVGGARGRGKGGGWRAQADREARCRGRHGAAGARGRPADRHARPV
mmetsp:Transcript_25827/g.87125  ORF Transcript_25827/g.87125 Transcript_25827/m.87125 type:complete len:222 (-) Transcript_25827:418-1083(-)